jgi:hypothetical protein
MASFEILGPPKCGVREADGDEPVQTCTISIDVRNRTDDPQTASLYVLVDVADAAGVFPTTPTDDVRFLKDQRFDGGESKTVAVTVTQTGYGARRYRIRVAAAQAPDADFTDTLPVQLNFTAPPSVDREPQQPPPPPPPPPPAAGFSLARVIGAGLRLVAQNGAGAALLTALFAAPTLMLIEILEKKSWRIWLLLAWWLAGAGVLQVFFALRARGSGAAEASAAKPGVGLALTKIPSLAVQMPMLALANFIGLILVKPLCLAVIVPVETYERLGFIKAAARSLDLTSGRLSRVWLMLVLQAVLLPIASLTTLSVLGRGLHHDARDLFSIVLMVVLALPLSAAFAVAFYVEAVRIERATAQAGHGA